MSSILFSAMNNYLFINHALCWQFIIMLSEFAWIFKFITIGRTVLEESDDLVILGVTFYSKMTFEKHLLEQLLKDLVSWESPGMCSVIDRFLLDAFGVLSCQFWSIVLQSGARLPIHTLSYWTEHSGAWFPAGGVFECDISRRRSVAVLCKLYKIRCNPVHPLNGALPGPYLPVRVTRCTLVAHRYTYALPSCRTLQYSRTFIPFSVSLWNDLANPVFDGVGLADFKSRANASLLA